MNGELVLHSNPQSRGQIARWMMEEVGRPYRLEVVGFGEPMGSAEHRALNPMAKVPVLKHGEVLVTETAAICAYLADAFPEAGLAPAPDSPDRGPYYRWLFFAAGPLEAAVVDRSLGVEVPAERQGMVGYGSFERTMDTLETAVSGDGFIAGDRFTAADLYLGAHIGWGLQFGSIERRPAFERYFDRIKDRPAAVRARELDDALLAEQQRAS